MFGRFRVEITDFFPNGDWFLNSALEVRGMAGYEQLGEQKDFGLKKNRPNNGKGRKEKTQIEDRPF